MIDYLKQESICHPSCTYQKVPQDIMPLKKKKKLLKFYLLEASNPSWPSIKAASFTKVGMHGGGRAGPRNQ